MAEITRSGVDYFGAIPDEMTLQVVYFVGEDLETLARLRLVSQHFNALVCDAILNGNLSRYRDLDLQALFCAQWITPTGQPDWHTRFYRIGSASSC